MPILHIAQVSSIIPPAKSPKAYPFPRENADLLPSPGNLDFPRPTGFRYPTPSRSFPLPGEFSQFLLPTHNILSSEARREELKLIDTNITFFPLRLHCILKSDLIFIIYPIIFAQKCLILNLRPIFIWKFRKSEVIFKPSWMVNRPISWILQVSGGWRGAAAVTNKRANPGRGTQSTQSNLTGRIKLSSRHSVLHQVSKTLLIFRIFLKLIIQLWAHLLKCPCRISDF